MPQYGLTPTPHFAYHGFKLENASPKPTSQGAPKESTSTVVFEPGEPSKVKTLNGTAFKSWTPPEDWAQVSGQADVGEPEMPELPEGMELSAGVVIKEPDGRVWIIRPKGGYGGYNQTFPKGHVEDGLSMQATAIKEAFEETGLKVKITGFSGDHEGDVTVTRFYTAERETGNPADAGRESEGVILAPLDKLDGFLNRKRDKAIAAGLMPTEAAALDPSKLEKVGKQMGSNPGGVYRDPATDQKFYIKQGQTKDHVKNELLAGDLYALAGSPTLKYRPVKGGGHIATEMAKLDKDRASKLSPAEIAKAQEDFAVHAWLANYDAVGTGGDNLGTVAGVPTALDLGGALAFRAQGKPKGEMFGTKVNELSSMRDPKISYDASKVFGPMTQEQIKASAAKVIAIPDDKIKAAVKSAGVDSAMADKLIARKADLAKQVGLAMDEANFNEADHPRGKGGMFAKTAGGGGSSGEDPDNELTNLKIENQVSGAKSAPKQDYGGLWKSAGDPAEEHSINTIAVLGAPPKTGNFYRNMLRRLIKDAPKFKTDAQTVTELKMKLGHSYYNSYSKLLKKADASGVTGEEASAALADAKKMQAKATELGYKAPGTQPEPKPAPKPEAAKPAPEPAKPAPKKLSPIEEQTLAAITAAGQYKPTPADLEKAKKNVKLQLQYVPGAPQGNASAQKLVDVFNAKYEGKTVGGADLVQKVKDFKMLSAGMLPLMTEQQQVAAKAAQEQAEKQAAAQAEAQAKAKEQAAKAAEQAKAEKEKLKAQHAEVTKELGISDPDELNAFDAFVEHFGGTKSALSKFKAWQDEAQSAAKKNPGHGFDKLTGFEMGCLKAYTGPQSGWINAAIRDDVMTPAQYMFESVLNRALDKLPKKTGLVRRGLTLPQDVISKMQPGKIWTHRNFASSNSSGWGGNTKLHIEATGKSGCYVDPISSHKGEDETLFKSNLRLMIHKTEKSKDGTFHVYCREM